MVNARGQVGQKLCPSSFGGGGRYVVAAAPEIATKARTRANVVHARISDAGKLVFEAQ